MSKVSSKFNIMDLIIIVFLLLIVISTCIKSFIVKKDEVNKRIIDAVIVIRISDVSDKDIIKMKKGDKIYSKELFGSDYFGIITEEAVEIPKPEKGDSDKNLREYTLKVKSKCLVDSDGLYSINDEFISPGMTFIADNGSVSFNCNVLSVKNMK